LAEADRSATTPQLLTVKAQALAHLGRGREAVAAVQQALRLAPNDAPVAYEASLVYAVLSEDDSALANAERALALGYGTRWFSFPWFETLRRDPEFQRLLAADRPAPG
jgi:Flp pilus assembly protein TadD